MSALMAAKAKELGMTVDQLEQLWINSEERKHAVAKFLLSKMKKEKASVAKFVTKQDVIDSLPHYTYERGFKEPDLKLARKMFGPRVHYLNEKSIKKSKLKPGQSFWSISGQNWSTVDNNEERMREVRRMKFGGFTTEDPYDNADDKLFNSKFTEGDDIVVDGFTAHYCFSNWGIDEIYGLGSGCNPVYIFI